MKASSEIDRITSLLISSFSGPHPWYGSPVIEVLTGINESNASKKLTENTHSIIELVLHMAAWRNFVTMKLKGIAFEMTPELNYPKPGKWEDALTSLQQSQKDLLAALASFPEDKLFAIVPARKYDFYTMLHGIVDHDVYHLGQIALIKKGISL